MSAELALDLFLPTLLVVAGAWMFLFPDWAAKRAGDLYEARKAKRLARGSDAYFEELREIEAYPPKRRSAVTTRILGGLLAIVAATNLYITLNN